MATKRPLKLKIRIPLYQYPRNSWRVAVYEAVRERQQSALSVHYNEQDKLEIELVLYFEEPDLTVHDVDNRLKDVLDALQGRAGGPKAKRVLEPIIPNDKQVYRVLVEKKKADPRNHGLGHLTIRRLSCWRLIHVPRKPSRGKRVRVNPSAPEKQ